MTAREIAAWTAGYRAYFAAGLPTASSWAARAAAMRRAEHDKPFWAATDEATWWAWWWRGWERAEEVTR